MSVDFSITGKTKILCVIGHPIGHSMSPPMHNAAIRDLNLDYVYVAFDVHPNDLKYALEGFKALRIKGINVTIPHKINVIQYLDEVDPLAVQIGAVNTIKNENGVLLGKNTDALGCKMALIEAGCKLMNKKVLFIGAGGAARAITFSIAEDVDQIVILNRTVQHAKYLTTSLEKNFNKKYNAKELNRENLKKELINSDILINSTSIGMEPRATESLVPKEFLHSSIFVFDAIYNPLETRLIKDAKESGCRTLGGLDMLVNQGALAFEWWIGKTPNKMLMKKKIIEFLGLK